MRTFVSLPSSSLALAPLPSLWLIKVVVGELFWLDLCLDSDQNPPPPDSPTSSEHKYLPHPKQAQLTLTSLCSQQILQSQMECGRLLLVWIPHLTQTFCVGKKEFAERGAQKKTPAWHFLKTLPRLDLLVLHPRNQEGRSRFCFPSKLSNE